MTQRVPLTAANAPYGQTFHHAETFVANEGKELIRSSLESIMQVKIDELEKLFYRYSVARRRSVRHAQQKNDTEDTEKQIHLAKRNGWKTSFSPHLQ